MPLADKSFEEMISSGSLDAAVWQEILAGVEELHRLGYVHRDLKPANVLYVNNAWVLADFGLVLPTARDTEILTSTHSAYGSQYYAAPEQAHDFRNVPEQADIFALGCMLHDVVDRGTTRVPFAQIRSVGVYGPILEKCTEEQPRKRFPTVASLRAALFDLWQTLTDDDELPEDADLLQAVEEMPNSVERWRNLIHHLESLSKVGRHFALKALNADLLVQLNTLDEVLFARLMALICEWARSTGFDWNYCDVVGDRLVEAYRISQVRLKTGIVLAALELAVSHNRWHVMNQVGSMLGTVADNGLVDRMLIELELEEGLVLQLQKIESVVNWQRDRWHPKIAEFLNRFQGE